MGNFVLAIATIIPYIQDTVIGIPYSSVDAAPIYRNALD
jgi:hypothetical protein